MNIKNKLYKYIEPRVINNAKIQKREMTQKND